MEVTDLTSIDMKLWKVRIKTYYFGIRYYDLYVLANNESNMLRVVSKRISKDDDAEVEKYEEIDLNDTENRII